MIVIENHIGTIQVSKVFLFSLIEHTVTNCFGVVDLSDSCLLETVQNVFAPECVHRGIQLRIRRNTLVVDLHIVTGMGANIGAITSSIRNKVRYSIEQAIGIEPAAINVYVDGIRS